MIARIKAIYEKYKEQIHYIIFGVATTAVNWIAYYLLMLIPFFAPISETEKGLGYLLANAIAFVVSVVFSYWANRTFVFENKVRGAKNVLLQFSVFAGTRLLSFGIEEALMFLFVTVLGVGELISKVPVAIAVVVLNYIFGKFVVFRRDKDDD